MNLSSILKGVLLAVVMAAGVCARAQEAKPEPEEVPSVVDKTKPDLDKLKANLMALSGGVSRLPGSPGNLKLAEKVIKKFADSGFANGTINFSAPIFSPGAASITCKDLGETPILAMHPSLIRPGNFKEAEFKTNLVYLGTGTAKDILRLEGVPLKGAIALMDYECGNAWMDVLQYGIKGIVFIGAETYFYTDSVSKTYNSEVNVPRYFVEREAGLKLKALCDKAPLAIDVKSEASKWNRKKLQQPWVLIPGSDEKLKGEIIVLTAAMDACSVVPERSYGALSLVNLDILLSLLDDFKETPPARSVLLVATNAHTQNFLGERLVAWFLTAPAENVERLRDDLAKELRKCEMYSENYGRLKFEKPKIEDVDQLSIAIDVLWEVKKILVEREEITEDPLRGETTWRIDLAKVTDEDLKTAASKMVVTIADEGTGFMARMSQNKEDKESLKSMKTKAEEFAAKSTAEIRRTVEKALTTFHDEVILEHWRFYLDESTGERLPVKGRLQNEVKRRLNLIKQTRMALSKMNADDQKLLDIDSGKKKLIIGKDKKKHKKLTQAEKDEIEKDIVDRKARLETLKVDQGDLTKLLVLFNKFDIGIGRDRVRFRSIAPNEVQRLELIDCRDKLVKQYDIWAGRHKRQLALDASNAEIRKACGASKISLVFNLDMDANSDRLSFPSRQYWDRNRIRGFQKIVAGLTTEVMLESDPDYNPFIWGDQEEPRHNGGTLDSHCAAIFFKAARVPVVTLKSAMTRHGLRFSPDDRIENLKLENADRLRRWLPHWLRLIIANPDCTLNKHLKPATGGRGIKEIWSTRIRTFAMDSLSGTTMPDVAVPETIVTVYEPKKAPLVVDGEVINVFANITDATGECEIYGLTGRDYASTAYRLDDRSCKALYTIDKGRIQTSKQMTSNLTFHESKTIPMFPCRELPVYNQYDPTLIAYSPIDLKELWIKEATRQSEPVKYGVHGAKSLSHAKSHDAIGPKSVFLWEKEEIYEPDRGLVITGQRRFALNSTKDEPRGKGFLDADELGDNIFQHAVDDMAILNESRIAEMKGVSNRLAEDLVREGLELAAKSKRARGEHRHIEWLQSMWMALGCQSKAQAQVAQMKMDMLKSVVIYMALLLPFCFFLQKLLFAFKRIEKELVTFIVMFVSAYLLFRLIHPAFRVAQNPEAIFIAFVLAAIGCVVTWVLNGYFSAEMSLLFNKGSFLGHGEVGNTTVGQTAMLLGVQNMRRRRIRTFLTTATIVLIVFTMLSFSSVSKRMKPSLLRKDEQTHYAGLFYHWPAGVPVDPATIHALEHLFVDTADTCVRRIWGSKEGWPLNFPGNEEDKQEMLVKGVLATNRQDPVMFESNPIVAGKFFSSPYAEEIMISVEAADTFGISKDDLPRDVTFMGRDMKLVGLFRDRDLQLARDLNPNLPLLPLEDKPTVGEESGDEDDEGSLEVDAENAFDKTVPTSSMVILPDGLAGKLGAGIHSISIVCKDKDNAGAPWALAQRLLKASNAKFFLGATQKFKIGEGTDAFDINPGVYYVRNNDRTSIGGLSKLAIPLIIAGSIILNTLLGSVHERKQEIAIYNAIGLNPTHIFLFFLAEALVYSVIGSVGGYLIGQLSAMGLKASGILSNVNINFSSLMVVYAILFTIALVLVSTIYPAYVATRTAVPSGARKWNLPDHDGTTMEVASPFIYQESLAPGIMYFLHEFFDECGEASLGDISAQFRAVGLGKDDSGRPVYEAEYDVAQAPYDVGVTQKVTVRAQYDDIVSSHRMHLVLERLSGQDTAWAATNRPFVARMRKLLLRWRTIDPNRQKWYVACGEMLCREGPDAAFPEWEEHDDDLVEDEEEPEKGEGADKAKETDKADGADEAKDSVSESKDDDGGDDSTNEVKKAEKFEAEPDQAENENTEAG